MLSIRQACNEKLQLFTLSRRAIHETPMPDSVSSIAKGNHIDKPFQKFMVHCTPVCGSWLPLLDSASEPFVRLVLQYSYLILLRAALSKSKKVNLCCIVHYILEINFKYFYVSLNMIGPWGVTIWGRIPAHHQLQILHKLNLTMIIVPLVLWVRISWLRLWHG